VRLVKLGVDGEMQSTDVMEINRSDDIGDIANLGSTLAEVKQLLAGGIVAAQAEVQATQLICLGSCSRSTPTRPCAVMP
jgi:hypothetical protein